MHTLGYIEIGTPLSSYVWLLVVLQSHRNAQKTYRIEYILCAVSYVLVLAFRGRIFNLMKFCAFTVSNAVSSTYYESMTMMIVVKQQQQNRIGSRAEHASTAVAIKTNPFAQNGRYEIWLVQSQTSVRTFKYIIMLGAIFEVVHLKSVANRTRTHTFAKLFSMHFLCPRSIVHRRFFVPAQCVVVQNSNYQCTTHVNANTEHTNDNHRFTFHYRLLFGVFSLPLFGI